MTDAAEEDLATRAIWPFLTGSFGLAWGLFLLFVSIPERIEAVFGPLSAHNPLFILAVYAPAISALAVVSRRAGVAGVGRFLSRLLLWRCSVAWAAFLLLGIPAVYVAGAYLGGMPMHPAILSQGIGAVLAAMGFMLALGPVEEIGWRGVALPLLQRRFPPLFAAILLGVIWGVWHLPAFLLSGTPQSGWNFLPFFAGAVAVSVIVTPLFNASGGSILLPALFHFQLNNPLWPDAQPYDMALFVGVALVVALWAQRARDGREPAATVVLPARAAAEGTG